MNKYHKILTVYKRDPETKFKYLLDEYATPEFEYLAGNKWIWTEKVDGMNIRVMWDGELVRYGGRTDHAQIPAFLLHKLDELFDDDLFSELYPETSFCLYGEGYGSKIQKGGGNYSDSQSFILFDVRIGDIWLERENVENIAEELGIRVIPVVWHGTLNDAIHMAHDGFNSEIPDGGIFKGVLAEGLVMRPERELLDRRGNRIITKIKYKDFRREIK